MKISESVKREIERCDFFKVPELSSLLGITNEYLYMLLKKGKIKGFRVGTEWRIPSSEVKKLLKEWNRTKKKVKKDMEIGMVIGILIGMALTLLILILTKHL